MLSKKIARRFVLLGGVSALVVGAAGGWFAYSQSQFLDNTLSVTEAYDAAKARKVFLIDIRRPEEWAETGIGEGAAPLDMRRDDFVQALDDLTGADKSAPIALICARGVRSRYLTQVLRNGGYEQIIDVPEGMLGSFAGPGWLKKGLPVVSYEG